MSTRTTLVSRLREIMRKNGYSLNVAHVIKNALAGKYHDWDSTLDLPKVQLVTDLRAVARMKGIEDVIKDVKNGLFDEEPTPEQLEELRQSVGPETFDKMFHATIREDKG